MAPGTWRGRATRASRGIGRSVMLVLLGASTGCAPRDAPDGRTTAQLSALRQEYVTAFNAGDVARVVALYAEDATLASDGGIFAGRDAIAAWVQAGVAQGSRLEPMIVEASSRSGTLAYEMGRTRRHVGDELHRGQYLVVMQRRGDDWKIVRHFSITTH